MSTDVHVIVKGSTAKPFAVVLQGNNGSAMAGVTAVKFWMRAEGSTSWRVNDGAMQQVPNTDPDYEPGMWAYQWQSAEVTVEALTLCNTWIQATVNGKPYWRRTRDVWLVP